MSNEYFCPICGKDMAHYIGESPSCPHDIEDLVKYIFNLQKQLDTAIKIGDKFHVERDIYHFKLDMAIEWIKSMVVNDGTHADISILAEQKLIEIEKV